MKVKLTAEPCVESSAEPFLLLGVGGDIIKCITGQPVELTAVLVNCPSALREVAELLTFTVHQTLGNVVLTERSAELVPCGGWTFGTDVEVILPPRACCSLKVVGGIGHLVIICNTSSLQLPLDAAEPVIGFKGLSGIAENRRMKMNEVIQSHHLIPLLSGVACYDFQQRMRVSAVLLTSTVLLNGVLWIPSISNEGHHLDQHGGMATHTDTPRQTNNLTRGKICHLKQKEGVCKCIRL